MRNKFNLNRKTFITIFSTVILLVFAGSFYFIASAVSDDDNKFTVKNISITSILDGEGPFDSNNDPGNDTSNSNGIVRNFDSITYTVNYDLVAKDNESQSLNSSADTRNVIIDVLFNDNVNATVCHETSYDYGCDSLKSVFGNYKYSETEFESSIGTSQSVSFTITNINMTNGSAINAPIVILRESTDTASKSIDTLSDQEKSQSYNTHEANFNKSIACSISNCNSIVSGIEKYKVNLYSGGQNAKNLETTYAIGYSVELEDRYIGEETKGKKGLLVPETVSFDINLSQSAGTSVDFIGDYGVKNYSNNMNYDGNNYTIYTDSNNTIPLPEIKNSSNEYIGNITPTYTNNKVNINVSNVYYNNNNVLHTGGLFIKSVRGSYTENTDDITINVTATKDGNNLSSVSVIDKLGRYVGTYESKITYSDMNNNEKQPGLSIFNYNEEFYIDEFMQYGVNSGNGLNSLTDFIKVDNDAIKLITNESSNLELDISYTNFSNPVAVSKFMFGKWTSEYFESTGAEGCPNISDLTKEELMNLYGGPCIRERSNVKIVDSYLDESLTEADLENGPIVVKTTFTKQEGEVNAGAQINIKIKARIKNNYNLVATSHQVVTNAVAKFTYSDGSVNNNYYLSNTQNVSAESLMKSTTNYVKTDYDFENRRVNTINSTSCNGTENPLICAITGNTILVSGVNVSKPTINAYYNDIEKTEFYYYPIEWRINSQAYTNDTDLDYTKAELKVYIPSYLQVINYGAKESKVPTVQETTYNGESYKLLTYTFDEGEIDHGQINDFSVYTNISLDTKDNSRPKVFVVADFYSTQYVSGVAKVYHAISPDANRTSDVKQVTVHNYANITMQGTSSPTYIEKNSPYTYNMIAYNNSEAELEDGYNYENAALYYVLPYSKDSAYEELSSNFTNSSFKVKIENLPSGYTAYYTNGVSANIINSEINSTASRTYTWVKWDSPSVELSNTAVTAIKIEKDSAYEKGTYFGGEEGINVIVTPVGNGVGDKYYSSFYIIADRPSNMECEDDDDIDCDSIVNSKVYYSSSRSLTSVYNRQISGFVFEDFDYSGLYDEEEEKLQNIPVSVCKIAKTEYDENDPSTYTSDLDDCSFYSQTDASGRYVIRGLTEGKYYVKFTFNNDKYTVTDAFKNESTDSGSADSNNSKVTQLPGTNIAVSKVIEFNKTNSTVNRNNINMGLKIKKQFAVDINKFITQADVTTNGDTKTYRYNKATKVGVTLRNPRNAHIRVKYDFVVENTKYYPGYIGLIQDYMPEGMTFNSNLKENQDWVQYGNVLYYNGLSGKLLLSGEKKYFSLVLDLDVKEGGTYINYVSANDLTLMGDELPVYDFSLLTNNSEGN